MMSSCLCRVPLTAFVSHIGRQPLRPVLPQGSLRTRIQLYAQQARGSRALRRDAAKEKVGIKEKLMAPAGPRALNVGKGFLAGASALGLGALCFYGLGLSRETSALDNSYVWTDEVRKRIRSTYMYFGSCVATTAMSAVAVSRNPVLMRVMTKSSVLAIGTTFVVMIVSGYVVRSLPYHEGLGAKQMALLGFSGIMGAIVAPLTMLGGPLLVRAAWYTAGVVGGLSMVAMSAPSEKFLNMGAPLAVGFGFVLASSLAGMFFPPTTALGAGLYSISVYGGLVLFGAFLLYDTQRIVKKAETHPVDAPWPYDPVNACMSIYMDTLNIFIRIAMILSGNKRK